MWTRGGGEVEEYQLGSKIQLPGIIKKDCISKRTADVTGLHPEIAIGIKEYKKWDDTPIAIVAH